MFCHFVKPGYVKLTTILCEGRGATCALHGLERPGAHTRDHLPTLGEVGKAVGERSMQIQTGEMRRAMDGADGVAPRRPGLMDARLKVLDALARVLTFGRGRVVRDAVGGNNAL